MMVRCNSVYYQDPKFYGDNWVLQCSDLDGTELMILANRNPSPPTVMRNMRRIIRMKNIPCTVCSDVLYTRGVITLNGGIQKIAVVLLTWERGNMPLYPKVWAAKILDLRGLSAVNERMA